LIKVEDQRKRKFRLEKHEAKKKKEAEEKAKEVKEYSEIQSLRYSMDKHFPGS
jgi:hypothetical protein